MTNSGEDAQQSLASDAMTLNPPCEKCGSANSRSCKSIFEAVNESSTVILSSSIVKKCAPPPKRSLGWAWVAVVTGYLVICISIGGAMLSALPVLALLLSIMTVLEYRCHVFNKSVWPKLYSEWLRQRICLQCNPEYEAIILPMASIADENEDDVNKNKKKSTAGDHLATSLETALENVDSNKGYIPPWKQEVRSTFDLIREHLPILARKRKQKCFVDEYGIVDVTKWNLEIAHFYRHVMSWHDCHNLTRMMRMVRWHYYRLSNP
jgi:hypothetical protein